MIYITGGLIVFFILVLICFLFRIWLESCRERTTPREIKGETLSVELHTNYVILAWVPALALMASLLLFALSWLLYIF